MNISQVIDNVKRLKSGYDISDEQIIADINRVEMNIIHNIVSGRVGDEEIIANFGNYDINTPSDKELIAPAPYDTIYQEFCCSQIDLQYEDSERYQNDSIIYNNTLTLLKGFWYRTHPQKKEHQYNKKICFGSNIEKSNIAGITLEQLKNELKSYLTKLEIQSELSKKENLSNKVTEFDAQFKDDSNDTYPTVNAVIEYLSAYYYTYDEILAILNSMKLDEDGNLTIEVDGEKTVIGQFNIQNGKSAYEIAVDNGFEGSEAEWLESLKGDDKPELINTITLTEDVAMIELGNDNTDFVVYKGLYIIATMQGASTNTTHSYYIIYKNEDIAHIENKFMDCATSTFKIPTSKTVTQRENWHIKINEKLKGFEISRGYIETSGYQATEKTNGMFYASEGYGSVVRDKVVFPKKLILTTQTPTQWNFGAGTTIEIYGVRK